MSKLTIIQKGESLPFSFDLGTDEEESKNFICTITVKQIPSDTATITRVIALGTDLNDLDQVINAWNGFLTSTETTTIGAVSLGTWYLTAVLANSSTNEQQEIPVRFSISTSWG